MRNLRLSTPTGFFSPTTPRVPGRSCERRRTETEYVGRDGSPGGGRGGTGKKEVGSCRSWVPRSLTRNGSCSVVPTTHSAHEIEVSIRVVLKRLSWVFLRNFLPSPPATLSPFLAGLTGLTPPSSPSRTPRSYPTPGRRVDGGLRAQGQGSGWR